MNAELRAALEAGADPYTGNDGPTARQVNAFRARVLAFLDALDNEALSMPVHDLREALS